jgi:hypothetical protein
MQAMNYETINNEPTKCKSLNQINMTLSDVTLIGKKVLVGIVVTLVPFIIIFGGLWLTQKLLTNHDKVKTTHYQTK